MLSLIPELLLWASKSRGKGIMSFSGLTAVPLKGLSCHKKVFLIYLENVGYILAAGLHKSHAVMPNPWNTHTTDTHLGPLLRSFLKKKFHSSLWSRKMENKTISCSPHIPFTKSPQLWGLLISPLKKGSLYLDTQSPASRWQAQMFWRLARICPSPEKPGPSSRNPWKTVVLRQVTMQDCPSK